jgi:hypothetical protein
MTAPVCAKPRVTEIEKFSLEERIRLRAYELYVQRGNESGSEFEDWLSTRLYRQVSDLGAASLSTKAKRTGSFFRSRLRQA